MTLEELAAVLMHVFGVRGGDEGEQAPTAALGSRDNWNTLFVAVQGRPLRLDERHDLGDACSFFGAKPEILDARAFANDQKWMSNGLSQASAHAEMIVVAAMLRFRLERPIWKHIQLIGAPNAPIERHRAKYNDTYLQQREQDRREMTVLKSKLEVPGRRSRIVANAPSCHFCWHFLGDLGIERGGLDREKQLVTAAGARPLTGWWNPLRDKGYGHGTSGWESDYPNK